MYWKNQKSNVTGRYQCFCKPGSFGGHWWPLTVKPVLRVHSKRRPKLVFNPNYPLMQVKSIAECSKGSILQYFRPSLSYHLSLRSLFCLFLSGRLRKVLLYLKIWGSLIDLEGKFFFNINFQFHECILFCMDLSTSGYFVWFDSLRPSQQSFSYVGMGLLGSN